MVYIEENVNLPIYKSFYSKSSSKGESSGSPNVSPEQQKRMVDLALEKQFAQFIIKDKNDSKETQEKDKLTNINKAQEDNKSNLGIKKESGLKPTYKPFTPKTKQNNNYNTPPPGLYPQMPYEVATPQPYQPHNYMNYSPGHYSPNVIGYAPIQPIQLVPVSMAVPGYFPSYVGYQPIISTSSNQNPSPVPKSRFAHDKQKSPDLEQGLESFSEENAIEVIEKFEGNNKKNSALAGTIVRLANTQNGSRFLQKQLTKGNPDFIEFILKEVIRYNKYID